jgi:hypothetical protein
MVTEVKDTDIKENQENNGIHMIDKTVLEEEEVDIRKADTAEEIGEMIDKFTRRRVKLTQKLLRKKKRKRKSLKDKNK